MKPRLMIAKSALREALSYDLGPARGAVARTLWLTARRMVASKSPTRKARGVRLMMRLHTAALSTAVDREIADWLRNAHQRERQAQSTGLWHLYDQSIAEAARTFRTGSSSDPRRLVGSRILVVKRARPAERGVIIADYQYVFPLLAGLFDLQAISARYDLVLEPSWAGVCTPEILLFSRLAHPVYVQTIEPRDHAFLKVFGSELNVVPLAANWWVDPRQSPPPDAARDIDVIMVAAWADIKRHWRVFRALASLRKRGHKLSVALVGYRYDRTREDIEALAQHFGIRDQVTAYERIPTEEVAALLARSKVHVLWSRRECANRAIIEAMLADVPVIVREGLTFGLKYPYINDQTGRFVSEGGLEDAILEVIQSRSRYSPRSWVLRHMTCEQSTSILNTHLRDAAVGRGEPWTEDLVVRSSGLDTQKYSNPADATLFEADYAFLRSCILPSA